MWTKTQRGLIGLVHGLLVCTVQHHARHYEVFCCRPVRPSVCTLYVTLVYCIQNSKRLKITSNFLLGLLAPSLQFLELGGLVTLVLSNSQGNPLSGGVKYTGWVGKLCDFQLKSTFVSEAVRNRPMVAMEC